MTDENKTEFYALCTGCGNKEHVNEQYIRSVRLGGQRCKHCHSKVIETEVLKINHKDFIHGAV